LKELNRILPIKNYLKMIRKPKIAEYVDTMISILPENPNSSRKEEKKMLTSMPPNGKDQFSDLQEALLEKDVIDLRAQLHEIVHPALSQDENQEAVFDLAEKMKTSQFLEGWENMDIDALLSRKPLPRIHIHHHNRADTENIHPFYVEQSTTGKNIADIEMEMEQGEEFPDLEEALRENDIIDLRGTLAQISGSSSFNSITVEEIDNYLSGNMSHAERETFEAELNLNSELNRNVELYGEVDEALHEKDVIELREILGRVMQSQHSTTWGMEDVEAFLNGELPENERDAFITEMEENNDLKAEVNLSKNISFAFAEKDIHHLRNELELIAKEVNQQSTKSFILLPEKNKRMRRNGTYAAVLLVLLGFSSVIWQSHNKETKIYDAYFKAPVAVSTFRSGEEMKNEDLNKGFELYNKSEYASALPYFDNVLKTDAINPIAHYWAGLTNRQIRHYPVALHHFQEIINHNDNLFIEQAEWFSILCILKMSGKENIGTPLEAVISRKGYYYKEALNLRSKLLKDD
jgi:tetratricopeptide (TPR) repeat protein